jgi:hypothetical protein
MVGELSDIEVAIRAGDEAALTDGAIAEIVTFPHSVFDRFDLPERL